MQHNKITENLGEFQKFLDNDNKTGMCLEDTIGFFDIRRIFGQFESIKQSGIRVTRIMTTLLVMLFYRSRNINSYFSGQYGKQIEKESGKNPYYDMLGNEDVPWRVILYLFARRYLSLISRIADHSKHVIRALIFDDSPLEKTGWKIEGVSKIHDHVTGRYILGFKLLVSGYWDGNSFIPIDFSLHRERGKELDKARHNRNRARRKARKAEAAYLEHKDRHLEKRALLNSLKEELVSASTKGIELEYDKQEKRVSRSKNKQSKLRKQMKQAQFILEEKEEIVRKKEKQSPLYGLSPARQRKQFKKKRDKDSHGHKRRSEADMSKTQSVIRMISRAVKRGFEFEYVLFDSWFFSKEILAHIESFRTKGIKLVAMVKMGRNLYRDCLSGQEMDANTLRKIYKKKGKAQRSRKYNATYIRVPVWYDNRRINLFFVRLGSGSKWKVFITNDLDLTFNKLLEVYHIRWSIEVFYKDAKQHLQLGKCQCNNFDSQIGAATLVMMQYIMLLLYKQRYYGQSLGSIFDLLSTQAQEENITRYLMDIFWEIAHGIGEILKVDIMELFEEIIRDHQKAEEITRLFLPAFERNRAA
ncbi:MAG: transposase [Bacteroidales bacterium]|nr:transposase [Bacteroidales bacterium]